MPFLIWNGAMHEPVKVDKVGSSLDILPTVLNLFGVEYDSRLLMGRDILSDSETVAIFSDRSFITNKGKYNAITGKFIANGVEEATDEYIKEMKNIVYKKYQMSRLVLEKDYYRKVFEVEK